MFLFYDKTFETKKDNENSFLTLLSNPITRTKMYKGRQNY